MNGASRRILRILIAAGFWAAVAASIASCATAPREVFEEPSFVKVTDPNARRELARGKPIAAADIYTARAARTRDESERQDYLLTAAEILYDRAMAIPGAERLAAVPDMLATPALQHRRDILVAKSLLLSDDAQGALAALPDPIAVEAALTRARLHETRAQAYRLLDDPDQELVARIALESELSDLAIIARSQEQIWLMLGELPVSTLQRLTTNVRGDDYQGWVELALGMADIAPSDDVAATEARREEVLAQWRTLFPDHPANGDFLAALAQTSSFAGFSVGGASIETVAVLLPLSDGATRAVAAAIRDGLIAAHAQAAATSRAPDLRFYDIGTNAGYARTAYENAVQDGADAVIGPLRKDAVAAIVTQRVVPVPTIVLNTVDATGGVRDGERKNAIQFGLAPEDEARAAASRAMALSLVDAVVLQSDDSRGDREARAFQQTMYDLGGDVVHVAVLPAGQYDYSEQIRAALAIDASDARFRTLSRAIGERLFFEPAIRNDVDVVFLALSNEQARSVRPQLDFFRASGVPRFGTSRIAAIDDDQKKSRDLNTIWFTDAPWVLDASLADDPFKRDIVANFPGADGAYGKLYALGADAWMLVSELDRLAAGERLDGYTGELSLGRDGRVRRRLDWAQYQDGIAVPVERIEMPETGTAIRPDAPN